MSALPHPAGSARVGGPGTLARPRGALNAALQEGPRHGR
jgi:hypothetical protein